MKRPTTWVRPGLMKHKKTAFIVIFLLGLIVYPLFLVSNSLSAFFVIDLNYRAKEEVQVDYDLKMNVYDNIEVDALFSERVIEHIDNAEYTIDIAMYSFNIEEIKSALMRAANRGVDVTIYYEYARMEAFDEFIGDAKETLNVQYVAKYEKEEDYYKMHHKLMLVDSGHEGEVLLTGPWNWSYYQEDLDPNMLIETSDPEIIKSFNDDIYRISRGFSGYNKFRDLLYLPWDKKIVYPNGDFVEVWFSPGRLENSIQTRAVDLIRDSQEKIDIGITIFDSYILGKELLDKAKQGVEIRLIVNAMSVEDEDSIVPWLKDKVLELELNNFVIYEGGTMATVEEPEYSIFHHNNMMIDDRIVLTGTANWTFGGFFINDENTFIINSKDVSQQFTEIFDRYLTYIN